MDANQIRSCVERDEQILIQMIVDNNGHGNNTSETPGPRPRGKITQYKKYS